MIILPTDNEIDLLANDLRDESSVEYIREKLLALKRIYEAYIAMHAPQPVQAVDHTRLIVLVEKGEVRE